MLQEESVERHEERNIRCAQLDEYERVTGGGVCEWLLYAGLQKRKVKGSEGSLVIIILKDKVRVQKRKNGVYQTIAYPYSYRITSLLTKVIPQKTLILLSTTIPIFK